MTAETAAPCVQGVQGAQSGIASQSMLQQVQDGNGGSVGGGGGSGSAYYSSTSTSTIYDPEYARMESWLDEHPDFVNDYFLRYRTEHRRWNRFARCVEFIVLSEHIESSISILKNAFVKY